jgi:peptidoglycan/xylan/chitin deacetylase (PgdA/CDA1 family)
MKPTGPVAPVLMYHEIASRAATSSRLAVPPGAFAAQLAYLHAAGFTTLTASALAVAVGDGTCALPPRPVVLTFDDGFADFHSEALPLLYEYGFTATVFVTTGWIQDAGSRSAGRRPGRMLSWQQILEAAEAGVEIGAHSDRHPELDQLSAADLRRELHDSKALLEDRLGRPVPGLAYPFGYSNIRVRRAARAAGHEYACAVGNMIAGPAWDQFAVPRLTIRGSTGPRSFDQIVHGRGLPMIFMKDRSLTRGWAMVRRTRAMLSGAARRA